MLETQKCFDILRGPGSLLGVVDSREGLEVDSLGVWGDLVVVAAGSENGKGRGVVDVEDVDSRSRPAKGLESQKGEKDALSASGSSEDEAVGYVLVVQVKAVGSRRFGEGPENRRALGG